MIDSQDGCHNCLHGSVHSATPFYPSKHNDLTAIKSTKSNNKHLLKILLKLEKNLKTKDTILQQAKYIQWQRVVHIKNNTMAYEENQHNQKEQKTFMK